MFDVENEKLTIIENVIKTDDEFLLREIKSLLCEPSLKEYDTTMTAMTLEKFNLSIQKSEQSIEAGHIKNHAEVRKIIDSWKK